MTCYKQLHIHVSHSEGEPKRLLGNSRYKFMCSQRSTMQYNDKETPINRACQILWLWKTKIDKSVGYMPSPCAIFMSTFGTQHVPQIQFFLKITNSSIQKVAK